MNDELVLTPGGYRSKSKVYLIKPGESVRLVNGRIEKVDRRLRQLADLGPLNKRPPHRPLMPGQISRLPQSLPTLGSGWICYADWLNMTGTPVSRFSATWTVPPPPALNSGQTVFLFNGIQNSTMIYQPVLQWGVSAAGGGDYWAVASWYADGQGGVALFSPLTRVVPGAVLQGVMTLTGRTAQGFSYNCEFLGVPNSVLSIIDVEELLWCVTTLEAYVIDRLADYPSVGDTPFSAIDLQTGAANPPIDWAVVNAVTDTGQHAVVVSNANPGGQINLYYSVPWVLWGTSDIGQGSGAVSWQIGDVNGDGRAEIIQLWNNDGRLGAIVYGWTGAALQGLWGTSNIGQGSGAVSWQIGDVNGDQSAELIQLWDNNGRLGAIVYGWKGGALEGLWGTRDIGQGSGAVSWQIGDINGDGRAEVVQLWSNNGRLGVIVYGWNGGSLQGLWGTSDIGQGSGAVSWQIGDVNGDGRAEIIQLWSNNGRLGVIVYGWTGAALQVLWATSDIGQGSGAVSWQIGDVNGDGRAEIIQLWDNNGRLGVIVYGWNGGALQGLWGTSNIGQGSGAVSWQIGDIDGDGRSEVVQMWKDGDALGMLVYGWLGSAMSCLRGVSDVGQGSGAIGWLTGNIQGTPSADLVQLWNSNGRLGVILYSPSTWF